MIRFKKTTIEKSYGIVDIYKKGNSIQATIEQYNEPKKQNQYIPEEKRVVEKIYPFGVHLNGWYWYKETKQACIDQINEFYTGFYLSDEFQLIID